MVHSGGRKQNHGKKPRAKQRQNKKQLYTEIYGGKRLRRAPPQPTAADTREADSSTSPVQLLAGVSVSDPCRNRRESDPPPFSGGEAHGHITEKQSKMTHRSLSQEATHLPDEALPHRKD